MPPDVDWQVTPAFQPESQGLRFRSRRRACGRRDAQVDRARRCLHRRHPRYRAVRLWRAHRAERPRPHHRLPDHRGRDHLARPQRRAHVPGHALGYDQATGFGLVQALARLDAPALPLGQFHGLEVGSRGSSLPVPAGASMRPRPIVVGRQEFAGYWEYLLDEAIFTAPAHPFWGGAALIGPAGDLCGIASLPPRPVEGGGERRRSAQHDRPDRPPAADPRRPEDRSAARKAPPRPWLGLYAVEVDGRVVVAGSPRTARPSAAGLATGDIDPCRRQANGCRHSPSSTGASGRLGEAGVDRPAHHLSATARVARSRSNRATATFPQEAPAALRRPPGISEPAPGARGRLYGPDPWGRGVGRDQAQSRKYRTSGGCRPAAGCDRPRSLPTRRCRTRTGA